MNTPTGEHSAKAGSGSGEHRLCLGFVGDLVLGRKVSERLRHGLTPEAMWGDLRSEMLAADAVVGNLEGPISRHTGRWLRLKAFLFRADPRAVAALAAGNIRCVALANNHMKDFNTEGIRDTRRHLAAGGIAFAGAGDTLEEANAPAFFSAGGRTIGFASITNTVPAFAAKPDRSGTAFWPIRANEDGKLRLAALSDRLRDGGAEVLVLSIHWGPNYRWWPPQRYRAFARAAIDAGFDIVHGHSAHVVQAAEFYRTGLILYDTGDFIDDFWPVPGLPTWRSFLFLAEIPSVGTPTLRLVPAHLGIGEVRLASGNERRKIVEAMIRRCRGYAIRLADDGHALIGEAAR